MKRKRTSTSRWWKILLFIHLLLYFAIFAYGILYIRNALIYHSYLDMTDFVLALLWTPVLLLHVGATYYYTGRGEITQLEREAYREGFADAARQLTNRDYNAPRLGLSDDSELIELPEKQKREG